MMKVIGISKGGIVSYADKTIDTAPNWKVIPNIKLKYVSLSNGKVMGINSADKIVFNNDVSSENYVIVPSPDSITLVQISFDGYNMAVMGINAFNLVYYADTTIDTKPNWKVIPGFLTWISMSNGKAMGCNLIGQVFFSSDASSGKWIAVPGSLKQLSFDGYNMNVIGINDQNEILYADTTIDTAPKWIQIQNDNKNIFFSLSLSNGYVLGNSAGNIVFNNDPSSINYNIVTPVPLIFGELFSNPMLISFEYDSFTSITILQTIGNMIFGQEEAIKDVSNNNLVYGICASLVILCVVLVMLKKSKKSKK
jgi:hypothetical protein